MHMEQVYKETMKMTKSSGMYKTKYYNDHYLLLFWQR